MRATARRSTVLTLGALSGQLLDRARLVDEPRASAA